MGKGRVLDWLFYLAVYMVCTCFFSVRTVQANEWGAASGEVLNFHIHWLAVSAGEAKMRMNNLKSGGYKLHAKLASVGLVRFFHSIDEIMQSKGILSGSTFQSQLYNKDQFRGKGEHKKTEYRFKREQKQVIRVRNQGKELPIMLDNEGVNDPLTGFYALRAISDLSFNTTFKMPVVDGEKIYFIDIIVGKTETINTPLGWFDVFAVNLAVEGSDLFTQRGDIVIWLTNDNRRMPVKVETEMKWGSMVADLVAFDDGRGETRVVTLDEDDP